MLELYDFLEEKGKHCVEWVEKFCILVEGENAGKHVKLSLYQKWFYYSILCFYGTMDIEVFNEDGDMTGYEKKYVRVVNDVLYEVASGNAKTTTVGFLICYFMYSKTFPSPNIFIGSNAYQQSRLCFDTVMKVIEKNKLLLKHARIISSSGIILVKGNSAKLTAMSSDGKNFEGIIPAVLILDEIHEMKDEKYASNLRKSTKRSDFLTIEMTTQGNVRGGYLDQRNEKATNDLKGNNEIKDYRSFYAIFEQDSEEEVFEAYRTKNMRILRKSNPGLGTAVNVELLKAKIVEMINNPRTKATILTKNFNIPQNPITSYFSERECRTKTFDESIFMYAPVFFGFDMAYTRTPESDLACLEILMVNPITEEEYCKDIYFLPKYWEVEIKEGTNVSVEKWDMIKAKSKEDTNILYNPRQKKYGYQLYANRGDLVIVDEALIEELMAEFGPQAYCDCTGITEQFILYYIAHLENKYHWQVCKFGLDPNKASQIVAFCELNLPSIDGKPPTIKFRMEDKKNSNPIIESTKEKRSRGLVYNNNRLSELHFASVQAKEGLGGIVFTNPIRSRKDGVIANLAARSAYNVFVNNRDTGEANKQQLIEWWNGYRQRSLSQQQVEEDSTARY